MTTPTQLYKSDNTKELLTKIINSKILKKFDQDRIGTEQERKNALAKIKKIIDKKDTKVLLRGIRKSKLKTKLVGKLNSNDSLYDGLFLVGEKAKNFLEKSDDIPHPVKNINSVSKETFCWIFETYGNLKNAPIDLDYFKNAKNKKGFNKALERNQNLIDYYLFGLHTNNSDTLVNFVSTTLSPEVALNSETTDRLIIFLWLPQAYDFYMNADKLNEYKKEITEAKLPTLNDSFYPNEMEISFKGFILPHFILAVHDLDAGALILNPALIEDKVNWIDDGLNINQENFSKFIKTTKYKRFLLLTYNFELEEKNVC